ncbi:alpha/beta fold hydrolase [Bacillus haynesii]|uniref:alpha/beta fold hydrolase n=1 Tax=Bacillus haynesii TaxID=1925021 RepID=UPI001F60FB37|nr:alpha/beta fold hydrolase [Bacillus haynesii]MCI4128735.1 alpha/beta fold hydrolase [Bacillus haynesii]
MEEKGNLDQIKRYPSILSKLVGWITLTLSIIVGVLLSIVVIFAAAGASGSKFVAFVAGIVALVIISGGGAYLSSRLIKGKNVIVSNKLTVIPSCIALIITGILVLSFLYIPAENNPMKESADVKYWNLTTGSKIAYTETAEKVTKPYPVLLVHGGPGGPYLETDYFAKALAKDGYAVYNYQQVGAGLSSRLDDPNEYTVARHVADLEAIRKKLHAEKIILMGRSWGGQLIARYMAKYPDNVEKTILTSPASMWFSPDSDIGPTLTESGQKDSNAAVIDNLRYTAANVISQIGGSAGLKVLMPEKYLDGLYEHFVDTLSMEPGNPSYNKNSKPPVSGYGFWVNTQTTKDARAIEDPRPKLKNNQTPILIMKSQYDYVAWEQTREYRDTFPNSTLVTIDGLGHSIRAPYQELYADYVVKYLNGEKLPSKPYMGKEEPWSVK